MRVLSCDPGYDRLGIAVMERVQSRDTLLHSSCFQTQKTDAFAERALNIGKHMEHMFQTYSPTHFAIETLFFNKNIKTGINVAHIRGILIFIAMRAGCTLVEYGPQEIKVAITGYGKSDKKAVIHMVQKLVPDAPKTALDDEYDAIAVAITALAHFRG